MIIEKFCPLKKKGDDRRCDKELCAWWLVEERVCAAVKVSRYLAELSYQVEESNQIKVMQFDYDRQH